MKKHQDSLSFLDKRKRDQSTKDALLELLDSMSTKMLNEPINTLQKPKLDKRAAKNTKIDQPTMSSRQKVMKSLLQIQANTEKQQKAICSL